MKAGGCYYHGFSLATNLVPGKDVEVFHDDFGLLGNIVRMETDKASQGPRCLSLINVRVLFDRLDQLEICLVGSVML